MREITKALHTAHWVVKFSCMNRFESASLEQTSKISPWLVINMIKVAYLSPSFKLSC